MVIYAQLGAHQYNQVILTINVVSAIHIYKVCSFALEQLNEKWASPETSCQLKGGHFTA